MPYDYTAWPTESDLTARLGQMGVSLPSGFDADAKTNAIASAVAWVLQATKRNFLPVTETRYFDGSGTGLMEVDPYRTVLSVSVVGYLGSTTNYGFPNAYAVQNKVGPNTLIQVYQSTISPSGAILVDFFPEGRSNIAVNAQWGYGPTIPADLWNAVLSAAAQMLSRQRVYSAAGPLESWKEADVSENFAIYSQAELSQYPELAAAMARYSRSMGSRLRSRGTRMV